MRKIVSILLALVLAVSLLTFARAAELYSTGDVSGDGKVMAGDARLALRASAKLAELTDQQKAAADVDGNGKVRADDARMILRVSAKLETFAEEPVPAEKNGEVVILFTSDIHCGIDKGFGLAGLVQVRETLEQQGYTTLLVDDGDAIQGENLGTLTKGEAMIDLMNAVGYDVAIPGNHEFDYSTDRFLELAEKANHQYISCNITKNGEHIFEPYVIKEAAGIKIGFVGVTTPHTITTSTPAYFQNDAGEYIYDFMRDADGERLYEAVQTAVDAARADGAEYVYVMGHMGMDAVDAPFTYADVISHTNGIDVFLDGHTHDTEQVVMKNKDGQDVVRSACGTKLNCIGYSMISPKDGITDTNIWTWNNSKSAPELLGIRNDVSAKIEEVTEDLNNQLEKVVGSTPYVLTIYDPVATDDIGKPIRMIRRAETNLGDLCADAVLAATHADIAIVNGGGVRMNIEKGDITYGDIISVLPFGNELCVVNVTGQQLLDALEWGSKGVPEQSGGFLQVAGMTYEIDASVPSGCVADEHGMMTGIEGERRVKNVTIGGKPIDPAATYSVGGTNYILIQNGDGYTAFAGAEVVRERIMTDSQALISYIVDTLGGAPGEEYAELTGQGRIVVHS